MARASPRRWLSGPTNGSLNLLSNGRFTYTPNSNFFGTNAFTYATLDGATNLRSARVEVRVSPLNESAPVPFLAGFSATNNTLGDGDQHRGRP